MWCLLLILVVLLVAVVFLARPSTPAAIAVQVPPAPPVAQKLPDPIARFYPPAKETIPMDFPAKQIGCCPFSKPMSTDLPPADVPMCWAGAGKTKLSQNLKI